jgi:hypothetical protein
VEVIPDGLKALTLLATRVLKKALLTENGRRNRLPHHGESMVLQADVTFFRKLKSLQVAEVPLILQTDLVDQLRVDNDALL